MIVKIEFREQESDRCSDVQKRGGDARYGPRPNIPAQDEQCHYSPLNKSEGSDGQSGERNGVIHCCYFGMRVIFCAGGIGVVFWGGSGSWVTSQIREPTTGYPMEYIPDRAFMMVLMAESLKSRPFSQVLTTASERPNVAPP